MTILKYLLLPWTPSLSADPPGSGILGSADPQTSRPSARMTKPRSLASFDPPLWLKLFSFNVTCLPALGFPTGLVHPSLRCPENEIAVRLCLTF